jgi:hypothetical protein
MTQSSNRWVLILAAGSGTRLSSLTANGNGGPVPKQFCSLPGGVSLLDETLARAATIASPARRQSSSPPSTRASGRARSSARRGAT